MNINDMVASKYLKQADVPDPVIVTISGLKQVNLARDDAPQEMKWIIKFREFDKPMVLNVTNLRVAGKLLGEETDEWRGKEIVLYTDLNVTNLSGEIVGGLRFRGQEKAPVKATVRQVMPKPTGGKFDDVPDDLPWEDEPGSRG